MATLKLFWHTTMRTIEFPISALNTKFNENTTRLSAHYFAAVGDSTEQQINTLTTINIMRQIYKVKF